MVQEYPLEKVMEFQDIYIRFVLGKAHYFSLADDLNPSQNRLQEIEAVFLSVEKENPIFIENYVYLARLNYYHMGNVVEALRYLEAGLRIESDNIKLLSLLLTIYKDQDNQIMLKKIASSILLYELDIKKAKRIFENP